jgi:uncharacterized membrane protein
MATYTIIGGDQKEYGPVSADDVRLWIADGRLNEHSLAKVEGDAEFRPLGKILEFAGVFSTSAINGLPTAFSSSTDWLERDYDLDIGGCISRGWELLKSNMGVLFVGALVYILIEGAIGILAQIPLIGALFSIANFIIAGPLIGGVFYLFIRAIRREPAEVGDIFSGFRRAFGQLFLGVFIQGLLVGLCLVPFIVVLVIKLIPHISQLQHLQSGTPPDAETISALKSILFTALPVAFLCAIPATYLSVSWKFTLPLIVDKRMNFWTAMKTSRKMVAKHWWLIFGLIILISLVNLAGFCACCVGMLFTIPIGIAALMFAYETIFGKSQTR